MSSLFEKSQLTKILISSLPTTKEAMDSAVYLDLSCTLKEAQFTGGQKQDIDTTTLCSTEQENINGLPAPSEISLSGNFFMNAAQDALRDAYDNDTTYGFQIIFPSGNGFKFLAEVRQHTWSSGTNGVVAATFSLRLKGKPLPIDPALRLVTDLPTSQSVLTGAAIDMSVGVEGGKPPYSYAWKKGGTTISGQTSAAFNKAVAASGDAGAYSCVVTDSSTPVKTVTSATNTLTVN
ncbi:immunoglobulin domain-containing protein [Enterobacter hormaechei]